MFVVVDRRAKVVRVSGLTVNEACWLGYRFAQYNPDLLAKGKRWYVVAFDVIPDKYSRAETYDIDVDWSRAAYRIAEIVKDAPMPLHDCPSCDCKPGCCR